MGTDDNVGLARFEIANDFPLLLGGDEAAEHGDCDRESGEPLFERFVVLITQNRCGRQHRDLFAVADRLEGCAHGDFGLAITDITADEAIHRQRRLHIALDVRNRGQLVRRLIVLKCFFEFLLPLGVGRECKSMGNFPLGVQL